MWWIGKGYLFTNGRRTIKVETLCIKLFLKNISSSKNLYNIEVVKPIDQLYL